MKIKILHGRFCLFILKKVKVMKEYWRDFCCFFHKESLKRNPIKMGSEIYFFQNLQNCIFTPFGLDQAKNNYSLVPCYMVENKQVRQVGREDLVYKSILHNQSHTVFCIREQRLKISNGLNVWNKSYRNLQKFLYRQTENDGDTDDMIIP